MKEDPSLGTLKFVNIFKNRRKTVDKFQNRDVNNATSSPPDSFAIGSQRSITKFP
jgi:hypothetical protein